MSWNDVNLADVNITVEPIAVGEYTFQLLPGAKTAQNDAEKLELSAVITDGPFAGRRVYFSYPDPTRFDWSPKMVKRLAVALGAEPETGEHPVTFFNRVTAELGAAAKFQAPIKDGKTTPEYPTPRRELDIFRVRAAA